jgi:trimeric autotransporter adhesin
VANLVNGWGGVARTATTTTLSITPTSIMHGTNVTASGTVTGSGGTPTGDVAFVADGTTLAGIGFEPLASGNFNGTTINDLPGGGPYSVVAKYSGDTKFAPSASAGTMVTVTPEGSSTVISILSGTSGNPISTAPSGSLVFVRVDVTGASGNGIPTGSVTLTDADASDGATLVLNSFGFAELQTKALPSGSHSFTATYSGDPSFNTSTAAAATLTITGGGGGGGAFSLSANPGSMTVAAGTAATSTITVTGSGGFTGSVALTTSVTGPMGAIDLPVCSLAPASISLSASSTSGTSALSCTTTGKSLVIYVPSRGPNRPIWLGVSAALAMLCIFLLSLPMQQKRRWATTFAFIVLASVAVAAGCGGGGGGGGNSGTTSGTYTVTVTGTSGSTATTTFTITVQ